MIFLLIYFLLLTAVFSAEGSWRKVLIAASWAAALVVAYGLGAILGIKTFVGDGLCARFAGSLGNSAYLGTYMLFAIFYAAYLAIDNWKFSKKLVKFGWLGLLAVFAIFLLLSQTRGAFLGLGAAIILVYFIYFNSSV